MTLVVEAAPFSANSGRVARNPINLMIPPFNSHMAMKCSICGREAVIYRKYEGKVLCRKHFLKSIRFKVSKTIRKYRMIKRHDKVVVGISGGKDSSLLLRLLWEKQKKQRHFQLEALLIDEGIKGYRDRTKKYAKQLCEELGIPYFEYSFKKTFGKTLDEMVKIEKKKYGYEVHACTYCGTLRRYLLNLGARELRANKLAIAHNLDDEAQAILANYIRGDLLRAVRMGYVPYFVEDEKFVVRIKPLRDIPEKETTLAAILLNLPFSLAECPYVVDAFRGDVRDMINMLEDKYPGIKYNIVRTFDKIQPALKTLIKPAGIKYCERCGEPTSQRICKTCILLERVRKE